MVSSNIQNEEGDEKKKINVCHYVEYEKIKKMSMIDFEFFYKEMYDNDYNYIIKDQLYGFRVVFFKESFFWKNGNIYPIYPWKNSAIYKDIVILYEKNLDVNSDIKFKKLKLENERLKKKLKKILYKNIWRRNLKKK